MDNRKYTNNGNGIFIVGDVYGSSFENINANYDYSNSSVTINDPALIAKLLYAAKQIQPEDPKAAKKANELQKELETGAPKVGKLQALYDWLRRNCTVENTLNAVKVFGALLIQLIK